MSIDSLKDKLLDKIGVLYLTAWAEYDINGPSVETWLENFENDEEKINSLYLLSHFMYFGSREMRNLLKCMFRDLYKYPIIAEIRRANGNTLDSSFIEAKFHEKLQNTRFIGMGNPSDSGAHLLYFFRQENNLSRTLFIHTHEIFDRYSSSSLAINPSNNVDHYVFIDDFCGSGSQAIKFSNSIVSDLKTLNPNAKVEYLLLFATQEGLNNITKHGFFDKVDAIFELETSFKAFNDNSRYYRTTKPGKHPPEVDKDFSTAMCRKYGTILMRSILTKEGLNGQKLETLADANSLGFNNCQLLIGFHHNTPDNTLPIFWYDEEIAWQPMFRRYNKKYGL